MWKTNVHITLLHGLYWSLHRPTNNTNIYRLWQWFESACIIGPSLSLLCWWSSVWNQVPTPHKDVYCLNDQNRCGLDLTHKFWIDFLLDKEKTKMYLLILRVISLVIFSCTWKNSMRYIFIRDFKFKTKSYLEPKLYTLLIFSTLITAPTISNRSCW